MASSSSFCLNKQKLASDSEVEKLMDFASAFIAHLVTVIEWGFAKQTTVGADADADTRVDKILPELDAEKSPHAYEFAEMVQSRWTVMLEQARTFMVQASPGRLHCCTAEWRLLILKSPAESIADKQRLWDDFSPKLSTFCRFVLDVVLERDSVLHGTPFIPWTDDWTGMMMWVYRPQPTPLSPETMAHLVRDPEDFKPWKERKDLYERRF